MIRLRLVLFQIAGILALIWMLAASHAAYAAAHHRTIVGPTERCTAHTLVSNRISTHEARHLRIGRRVHVAGKTIALKKGDSVWKLCRHFAGPAAKTVTTRTPTLQPEVAALTRATGELTQLAGELRSTQAQLTTVKDQLTASKDQLAATNARLVTAEERITKTNDTVENRLAHPVTTTASWTNTAALILSIALLIALIALAALIAYFVAEQRRLERTATQRRQELAEATTMARSQVDKWRGLLGSLWPCLTLGVVHYELAADAVEESVPAERRTFPIEITGMTRRNEHHVVNCRLPWGEVRTYDPPVLVRELHSDAARAFYQSQAGIRLKPDVTGRRILATNLPDFNKLLAEAERTLAEPRPRVMTAA